MDRSTQRMMMAAVGAAGQQEWAAPGTYSFEVPSGVTSISAVAIGGGGGGVAYNGGVGGNLRWISNIDVTQLEILTITIPAIVVAGIQSNSLASLSRGGTTLLSSSSSIGGNIGGGNGKSPGNGGGYTNGSGWSVLIAGGGGGAGGYDGDNGGGANGANGTIYNDNSSGVATTAGQTGGSVGSKGQGATGATPGSSGSGGGFGQGGYGGGAENNSGTTTAFPGGAGGPACVRIIWGAGRAYPSTRTSDE